ncbi:hypothetical protein SNE40_021983 [Patella caerulea]|uniref:Uncharacterized protein n=1 Tax=Patella caerulea TaxID=87958 RepID=A0AAN8G0Q1_PATCE
MEDDDYKFYHDNCHGDYIAIYTKTVPKKWLNTRIRKHKEVEFLEDKKTKQNERRLDAEKEMPKLNIKLAIRNPNNSSDTDTDYACSPRKPTVSSSPAVVTTSDSAKCQSDYKYTENNDFPDVLTRNGRKTTPKRKQANSEAGVPRRNPKINK